MIFAQFKLPTGGTAGIRAIDITAIIPHEKKEKTETESYVYATHFPEGLRVIGNAMELICKVETFLILVSDDYDDEPDDELEFESLEEEELDDDAEPTGEHG